MATAVDGARDEIQAAMAALVPELEGLRDYARLNLHDDTRREVDFSIAQYDRRLGLLTAADAALASLVGDGYPALDVREVADVVYQDLTANAATIEAALRKFASNAATSLRLNPGASELKP